MIIKVKMTSNRFDLIPRLEDAKILGIIKKIEKGFLIPPVKKINNESCKISIVKKIKADLSES
tara:strand:+ start:1296 stop:1484 length:189 start_codon:yes stop_codon:yes gene_type:complete